MQDFLVNGPTEKAQLGVKREKNRHSHFLAPMAQIIYRGVWLKFGFGVFEIEVHYNYGCQSGVQGPPGAHEEVLAVAQHFSPL